MEDKLFWFVILVLYGFFFTTMIYADFAVTFEHGVMLCESTFSGDFFGFYDHAIEGIYNNPAVYDIGIYLIWGIWCIPVYIVTRFWHVAAAETPVLMLYGKLLVVLFHILTAWVIMKIGRELRLDAVKQKLLLFLYVTSLCVIVPTMGNGQFDIIPTFFTLFGTYYFIKGNYKRFLVVMSFAVALKVFAVFLVIPLILVKEKRILFIIRDVIITMIATVFYKLLFWGKTTDYYDTLYFYSPDQYTTGWVQRMFKIQFPGGQGDISLFILFFILLCGLAYFLKSDWEKRQKAAILYGLLTYLNFFLFISAHPQWIVLLIPYLYLFAFCNEENYRLNTIWATLIDMLFLICMSYKWNTVFWGSNELRGIEILFPLPETQRLGGSLGGFIDQMGYGFIYPGLVAALVAVCAVFLWQNFTKKAVFIEVKEKGFEQKLIWTRVGLIVVYLVVLLGVSYV